MKIIKVKQWCLLFVAHLIFFRCAAMEYGNNQLIKFGENDWKNIRISIENCDKTSFVNLLNAKTAVDSNTIEFLCTRKNYIGVVRKEISSEKFEQIQNIIQTNRGMEDYEEMAKEKYKDEKNRLVWFRMKEITSMFALVGIPVVSIYASWKSCQYFDKHDMGFLGLASFATMGISVLIWYAQLFHLPPRYMAFKIKDNEFVKKINNAQGIVIFFENIKKLSEKNKKPIQEKEAGQ